MRATAQHILVDSEVIAETLNEEIIGGGIITFDLKIGFSIR